MMGRMLCDFTIACYGHLVTVVSVCMSWIPFCLHAHDRMLSLNCPNIFFYSCASLQVLLAHVFTRISCAARKHTSTVRQSVTPGLCIDYFPFLFLFRGHAHVLTVSQYIFSLFDSLPCPHALSQNLARKAMA